MDCECRNWARTNQLLITNHHRNCKKYDPEKEAYEIIGALLDGIQAWANDEDGIHPNCWEAFKNGACFIGQPNRINVSSEGE